MTGKSAPEPNARRPSATPAYISDRSVGDHAPPMLAYRHGRGAAAAAPIPRSGAARTANLLTGPSRAYGRAGARGHAHLGVPMIARVRRRMLMIALSPDAARRAVPAAGRLLVSSRQACSVVMARLATAHGPGWSRNSHPGPAATRRQVWVTGPVTAIVTVSPGCARAWARRQG